MNLPELTPQVMWERSKLTRDFDHKFQMYWVSLLFTLAALAVQSATRGGPDWRVVPEVTGWCVLLSAGLIGMVRLKRVSRSFRRWTTLQWRRQLQGEGLLAHLADAEKSSIENQILQEGRIDDFHDILNVVQMAFTCLGIACLVVSRGALLYYP